MYKIFSLTLTKCGYGVCKGLNLFIIIIIGYYHIFFTFISWPLLINFLFYFILLLLFFLSLCFIWRVPYSLGSFSSCLYMHNLWWGIPINWVPLQTNFGSIFFPLQMLVSRMEEKLWIINLHLVGIFFFFLINFSWSSHMYSTCITLCG